MKRVLTLLALAGALLLAGCTPGGGCGPGGWRSDSRSP